MSDNAKRRLEIIRDCVEVLRRSLHEDMKHVTTDSAVRDLIELGEAELRIAEFEDVNPRLGEGTR